MSELIDLDRVEKFVNIILKPESRNKYVESFPRGKKSNALSYYRYFEGEAIKIKNLFARSNDSNYDPKEWENIKRNINEIWNRLNFALKDRLKKELEVSEEIYYEEPSDNIFPSEVDDIFSDDIASDFDFD